MQAKNRKERGEPGNIYHVRNMIGSEKFMWANERIRLRFMDRIYSFRYEIFMENRAGLGGTTLHSLSRNTASYGPLHSKNNTNLLAYNVPGKLTLYTLENAF